MTAAAANSLRKGLYDLLVADGALAARLGGARVYDEAPRNTPFPYVAMGDVRSSDWSTSTDVGAEHFVTIDVWTLHHGVKEALEIGALVTAAIEPGAISLTGQRLISIATRNVETRRENSGRHARARLTFRAVTERI